MTVVETLPARPLRPAEVDALSDADGVAGAFPVASRHPSLGGAAVGVVVVVGSTARALALVGDDGWTVVGTRDVETTPGGAVALAANDAIDSLQATIRAAVDDRRG
jgi:hypothetical protein